MSFLIPLSFAYAVVKHRLLDIPVLLGRSARYLLVQRGFSILLSISSVGPRAHVDNPRPWWETMN